MMQIINSTQSQDKRELAKQICKKEKASGSVVSSRDFSSVYNPGELSRKIAVSLKSNAISNLDNKKAIAFTARYNIDRDLEREVTRRFDWSDVSKIKSILTEDNVKFLSLLMKAKDIDNKNHRLNGFETGCILETITPNNSEFVQTIFDAKTIDNKDFRFKGYDICFVLGRINDVNSEHAKTVLNAKDGEDYRFSKDGICRILSRINESNKGSLPVLLSARTADSQARFSEDDLREILSSLNETNGRYLSVLVDAKTIDGKDYRFNGRDIGNILGSINSKNEKFLNILVNAKTVKNDEDRFNSKDIAKLLAHLNESKDKHLEIVLHAKTIGNKNLRFNPQDIIGILSAVKNNSSSDLETLIKAKTASGKNFKFDSEDIVGVFKGSDDILDESLNSLIEDRANGNKVNLNNPEYQYIKILCDMRDIEPDDLELLLNLRSPNSSGFAYDKSQVKAYLPVLEHNLPHYKILTASDIEALTDKEKLKLVGFYRTDSKLVKELHSAKVDLPVFPRDSEEKDQLLKKLYHGLFSTMHQMDIKQINETHDAIDNLDLSIARYNMDNYAKAGLPLEFSKTKFVQEITDIVGGLSEKDRNIALGYFNFSVNKGSIEGYPTKNSNNKELDEILESASNKAKTAQAIDRIKPVIEEFIEKNKVNIPDKALAKDINTIIKAFPEFITVIGKKQHNTHAYTVDIHMLKALQELVNDDDYKKLSPLDKKIAKLAVLFHDISKPEGIVDPVHPDNSEPVVYKMMKRFKLSGRKTERICAQVKNHHWVQNLELGKKSVPDVAFDFRKPGDFEIARIFARADLKAIGNKGLYDAHKNKEARYSPKVQDEIDKLHSRGIYLPLTKIPRASDLKSNPVALGKDAQVTKNVVVKLNKDTDFEALGFKKGTDSENFYALIHAVNENNMDSVADIEYASKEGYDGVFSASYITLSNNRTYENRRFAFLFDVDPSNITAAIHSSALSGGNKSLKTAISDTSRSLYPNTIQELMKKDPDLSNKDYKDVFRELSKYRSITDIKSAKLRKLVVDTLNRALLKDRNRFNEVVIYAPKPKAILAKVNDPELIPYHLRKYAQNNDMPIILI